MVVADHLKVDPVDLHMSSDHMSMHHADLRAAHAAADSAVQGAQTGWVGASAAALQAKLTEWQAATTKLCGDIEYHGQAFRSAGLDYEHTDDEGSKNITREI